MAKMIYWVLREEGRSAENSEGGEGEQMYPALNGKNHPTHLPKCYANNKRHPVSNFQPIPANSSHLELFFVVEHF